MLAALGLGVLAGPALQRDRYRRELVSRVRELTPPPTGKSRDSWGQLRVLVPA
ncbi:MAG: hypothetical protein ABSF61_06990 [Anaerolineales bacterium]